MFPASMNKSRSTANVTRTHNKSRMNNSKSKEISSRVYTPMKIESNKRNERDFSDNVPLNSTECRSFADMRQIKNVDSPSQSRKSPAFKSIKRTRRKSQFQVYRRVGLHRN